MDRSHDDDHHPPSVLRLLTGRLLTIYKSIAVSMRLLLTGSSGDAGLVETVLPMAALDPLRVEPMPPLPADHLVLPADTVIQSGATLSIVAGARVRDLTVGGGAVVATTIGEMFDSTQTALRLADWLAQPFLRPEWSIKSFISTVASKDGGAHLNTNQQLAAMQRWGYFHWHVMAGMARAVRPQIAKQLAVAYPSHVRAVR
jgi:hypothetical protein